MRSAVIDHLVVHARYRDLVSIDDNGFLLRLRQNRTFKLSVGPFQGGVCPFVCIFSYTLSNRPGDGISAIPKGAGDLTIASRSNVVSKEGFITFTTRYIYISLVVKRDVYGVDSIGFDFDRDFCRVLFSVPIGTT